MTAQLDVITFGEAMGLLVADAPGPLETVTSFHKRTAGAETNVAIGLARLGLNVAWASRLGNDAIGRYILSVMEREGIACTHVSLSAAHSTGIMFKTQAENGEDPATEYHRRGSAASHMTAADVDMDWLLSARHLHATGVFAGVSAGTLALSTHTMDAMRAGGRSVSFDPNLRPALWPSQRVMIDTINDLAARADWVLPGIGEGQLLTGESTPEGMARFYRQRGAAVVVVKLGAQGAYFDSDAGTGTVPAAPVKRVIDTVGAGDGFAVGILSALLTGTTLVAAVRRAAWIGARAVQVVGDSEGLPTLRELEAAGL